MTQNGKFETQENIKPVSEFYDELSLEYADMTEISKRIESETKVFEKIIFEKNIKKCLDAGCGIGLHSIILSKLGVDVVGIDLSKGMILKAQELSEKFNSKAKFETLDFLQTKDKFKDEFDLVICLGNTLPHLLNERDLLLALRNFHNALKKGGLLIVQILNYDKIIQNEERIINIRETKDKIFIRFYDFEPTIIGSPSLKVFEIRRDFLKFNVLIINKLENYSHKIITTRIKPIKSEELCRKLSLVGFKDVEIFGNLMKDPFEAKSSKNIVAFANKI